MQKAEVKTGLMEWLTDAVDGVYLSDLKLPENRHALLQALKQAPGDIWPVKAWMDLTYYLTGTEPDNANEYELRDDLDRWLRHH